MAKSKLVVANIVASSTDGAWSQTYHAGGVTAVVSVRQKEGQESASLSLVGKDLLNTFESEYFTLEEKNLASIKQAVALTYEKSKDTHDISLIVSSVIQNAVYVVLAGSGKIVLIRKGHVATLLEQKEEDVLSASGFLEPGDIMILETLAFENKVTSSTLLETLTQNSVMDSAEILSPVIHKEQNGGEAALLFSYDEEDHSQPMPEIENVAEEKVEAPLEEKAEENIIQAPPFLERPKKKFAITHRQKIFLTIAVVLAVVLAGTIYFSLQKKQNSQNSALFSQVFAPAEKKYEEGQGLKDLNSSLAQDDFNQAKQMLESAKGKFPANSSEEKQILSLLDKVNTELGSSSSPIATTNVTKVDTGTSLLLDFANKHSSAKYFALDETNFYFADNTGISKSPKTGGKDTQIIQNGGDYKTLGGFATYLGNMYIVDAADGIDKYPVASSGYGNKVAYFSGTTPDLSKAISMAIDGSVWLLTSDGNILSYTKGAQDNFTVSGLPTPLKSPSQIVTTVNDTNLYILDNNNSRLVVLKKNGSFVAQYANTVIKSATQMDIDESGKKAYFLSGGSIYELDMK